MLELKLTVFHRRRLFSRGETHIEADFSPGAGAGEIVVGRLVELFLRSPMLPADYQHTLISEVPPETVNNRRGLPSEDNSGTKPETIFLASGSYQEGPQRASAESMADQQSTNNGASLQNRHFTVSVQTNFREFRGDTIVYNVATARSGIVSALGTWATPRRVASLAPLKFDTCLVGSEIFRDGGMASRYGFGPSIRQHEELRVTPEAISLRWMRIESRGDIKVIEDPFLNALGVALEKSGVYPQFLNEIAAKL